MGQHLSHNLEYDRYRGLTFLSTYNHFPFMSLVVFEKLSVRFVGCAELVINHLLIALPFHRIKMDK